MAVNNVEKTLSVALELTPALVVLLVQFLLQDLRLKMTVNWVIDKFILTMA